MGKKSKYKKREKSISENSNSSLEHRRKYKKNKHYKTHVKNESKHRFDSESSSSRKFVDGKLEFTFSDYKSELNRLIYTENEEEKLVLDMNDFWQFVNKYEAVLKRSAKPILQKAVDKLELNDIGIPTEYSKSHCVNIKLKVSFEELYGKIPPYDEEYDSNKKHLTKDIVKQFVDILLLYMDFKNKEKFNKLKKLRKAQADLPVAEYRFVSLCIYFLEL